MSAECHNSLHEGRVMAGLKNITSSADQFRRWLSDYVGRKRQASEAVEVMRELRGRLHVGRKLTREAMHER